MSQTIVIDLPEETKAALDDAVREEGMSQNELIEKALKDYLFIRRFRNLREQIMKVTTSTMEDNRRNQKMSPINAVGSAFYKMRLIPPELVGNRAKIILYQGT